MMQLKTIISFLFLVVSLTLSAQKQVLLVKESDVIAKAQQELDIAVNSGIIKQKVEELGIKGSYTFDITLHKKGEVLTVFAPFEVSENIKQQNAIKDIVKSLQFSFKMPKDKRYKFRYTFNFN